MNTTNTAPSINDSAPQKPFHFGHFLTGIVIGIIAVIAIAWFSKKDDQMEAQVETWMLVITFFATPTSGVVIEKIDGFKTELACGLGGHRYNDGLDEFRAEIQKAGHTQMSLFAVKTTCLKR